MSALLACACLIGCGSKADAKDTASATAVTAEVEAKETPKADVDKIDEGQVLTQQVGDTNVSWLVKPNGDVFALVKDKGKDIPADQLGGKLSLSALPDAGKPIERTLKNENGLLTTNVGPLAGTVNELKYDLDVQKKPVSGVIEVPKAGTDALIEDADIAAKAKFKPGTKGPHGGIVQVVDEHVVEIVGQKGGGDIRVYFLDDDLKPLKVGDQKLKLALYGGKTYWVELKPAEENAYFVGTVDLKTDPTMITVVIEENDDVDVCLVDYVPGHVILWGPAAPVFAIYVVASWDVFVVGSPVVVVHPGKHKGKHKKWKH
jgi:hypothetical protein